MKIAVLAPASVNHTVKVVNDLEERGHDVYLFSLKDHKEGADKIRKGVRIKYLPIKSPYGYYLCCFALRSELRKLVPDVLNVHFASGYGTLSRWCGKGPSVLSVWGSDIYEFPRKNKWNRKNLIKNLEFPNSIISTSAAMAEETDKYLKKGKRPFVIPFGVDIDRFGKERRVIKKKNIFKIICIKNLKPIYGISYLIEAMEILSKLTKDTEIKLELNVYGKGGELHNLEQLTKKLGVEGIVNFKGYIQNEKVPEALLESDICCIPSLMESFGVSVIEAMAAGIPVVATKTEGFKEIIEPDVDGYLVDTADSRAIADKIWFLINNPLLGIEMSKKASEKVRKLYDWNKNMDAFEQVLFKASADN